MQKKSKKLIREKVEGEDDFSDDEDKEFAGVDELLEKKLAKEPKGEKRAADSQATPGSAKKQRTDGAANGGPASPPGISEKDVEKQIRDFLSDLGKVPLSKLINKFRTTISTIGKPAFKNLMKRITEAKKEEGQTLIFLKDDQYRDFR